MSATARSIKQSPSIDKLFWLVVIAVMLIALGSFALSYAALVELAAANGVRGRLAYVWPLIVDVSVVVFTAAILVAQLQRRGARLVIGLTVFYGGVTIAGNVLHAPVTALGWFVAALPPLSLIAATEVLRAMAHHQIAHGAALQSVAELQTSAQQLAREIETQRAGIEALVREKNGAIAQLDAQIEAAKAQLESAQGGEIDLKTRQSYQIDGLIAAGLSQRAAAEVMGISESTLRTRIKNLNGDSLLHREVG